MACGDEPEPLALARASTSARSTISFAPLIPAGFYYKTFMWPQAAWKRSTSRDPRAPPASARAPSEPDPDRYASAFAHCDVLVVGAGPAGLAAALAARPTPARA